MQFCRHFPPFTMDKKKTVKKSESWVMFFTTGCVFYRVGDWDDLQIDLHVSLHDGFKIQFAGIVPVFLEFNAHPSLNINRTQVSRSYCFHVKISLCIEYDLLLCID